MDVPGLGVKSKLQLPAYTTATEATPGSEPHLRPSCHSLRQRQILNPLSEASSSWILVGILTL